VVIVSPHFGCLVAAGALRRHPEALDLDLESLLEATPTAAKARITARETNVAGAAWRRSLADIRVLPCLLRGRKRSYTQARTRQRGQMGPGSLLLSREARALLHFRADPK
jgi:hypothetical protein